MAYDIRILNFAAYRDASREGEGKGEEREKRLPNDPEYESLQGISSYCAKRLPCDPGSGVAWTTTALQQQPIRIHRCSTSVHGILPHKLLETSSVSLRISTY